MDRPGFKYGLLIAPIADRRPVPGLPRIAGDLEWKFGRLEQHVSADQAEVWKKSFGKFRWDEVTPESLLVYCVRRSSRANVQDAEHEDLNTRLYRVFRALKLVDFGLPMRGHAIVLTGEANSTEPFDIATAGGFHTFHPMLSPYYANVAGFWEMKDLLRRPQGEWVADWATRLALLDGLHGRIPPPLSVGMLAYIEALQVSYIEFRIPHFVRAAESVLALPKQGGGAKEFARRASLLVPNLETDPFLGPGLSDRLERMYVLRNECVHGMIPFEKMQLQGADQNLEARRIEYLAERLARRAMVLGLTRAHEAQFADRASLEDAWQKRFMP